MKNSIQIFLLVIVCSLTAYSQTDYKFRHLTSHEGLGNSSVLSISKDTCGFMWFGTEEGLYRYDAYEFKEYKQVQNNKVTLANNYCWALYNDSQNNLWIGNRGALNVYNQINGVFNRYYINDDHKYNKNDYFIYAITEDKNKKLWVGTINGLFNFDKDSKKFKKFSHSKLPSQIKLYRSVAEDHDGNIWISTDESDQGGLFKYSNSQSDTLFQHNLNNKNSLANNNTSCLFIDSDNNIWIGHREGIDKLETTTNTFTHYSYNSSNKNSISSNNIYCINQSPNGDIWIGTDQGISIINTNNNQITRLSHNKDNNYSLLSNSIHSIYFDENGTVWIGSRNGGIDVYDVRINKFISYHTSLQSESSPTRNNVQKFIEDKNGNIWISTDGGGINLLDKTTNKINAANKKYNTTFNNEKTIPILFDNNQNLWTGYWMGGITVHSFQNNELKLIKNYEVPNNSFPDSRKVLYIHESKNKQIWIGTWYSGLFKYEPKTEEFIHYPVNDSDNELSNCVIHKLYDDHLGNLWIGTEDEGLYCLNPATNTIKHYAYNEYETNGIKSRTIFDIFQDSKKRLWIGSSGGGLSLYDYTHDNFKVYDKTNGLPSNSISSILEDEKGHLWIYYDNGISKIELIEAAGKFKFKCTNFDINDGIQGIPVAKNAAFLASDGQMFFGGPYGFNSFYPDSLVYNTTPPNIYITELRLNYKTVILGNENVPITKNIEFENKIDLSHKQSVITLKFTALNYLNAQKNKIYYTLENFDNEWIEASNNREASYTNLNPGTYIFKIKASNNDGYWNPIEKHLKIIIHPPFWRTKLFIAFVIIALLSTVLGIYFYKISSIKREKLLLEKQVNLRTKEINTQKDQILEKNQILEYQKKELEELTEELKFQTEELQNSNESIEKQRDLLENASSLINKRNLELNDANIELNKYKNQLEQLVLIRTSALEKAKEKAEESDKLKTAFLQNLSHEIRTPMNGLKGFCELITSPDLTNEKRIYYASIINNSADQLLSIVEDILTISKLETKQSPLKNETFNIDDLFANIQLFFEKDAQRKNISFHKKTPLTKLQSNIYTDKLKLTQILNNLISNAFKFTQSGEIAFGYEKNGNSLLFYVKDTGIGIAPNMHDIIFNRFTQANNSIQIKYGGSGLGLSISKAFVELMGGKIWYESELGKGSCFYFSIPFKKL